MNPTAGIPKQRHRASVTIGLVKLVITIIYLVLRTRYVLFRTQNAHRLSMSYPQVQNRIPGQQDFVNKRALF